MLGRRLLLLLLLSSSSSSSSCLAFQSVLPRTATFRPPTIPVPTSVKRNICRLHAEDGGGGPARKRRVRKDAERIAEAVSPPPPPVLVESIELKPRDDDVVEFKIQDVRDVISGTTEATDDDDEDEEDEDDDEWEYVDADEEEDNDEYEYVVVESSGKKRDSLEQLLADAKSFRVAEKEKDKEDKDNDEEEGGISIPKSVSGAISTIVTIDFFVVMALLVWFLAGIFGQYVLKDEAIQIAFNNIFEPVVQPALGILMIGSAAGAMFRKDEDEEY